MDKNLQIAQEVLEKVGGKDNVTNVVHCMTRLRFDLKDASLIDEEGLKNVSGILGVVNSGGQFQVIVGQNVPKVYKELCELGGFKVTSAIDENLDKPKEKFSLKNIGNNILNYMSGSMSTIIPGFMAAAMFKTLGVLFGPDILKLVTVESDFYILCDFLYDTFFYFMPIMLGYACAKKLNSNVIIGMFIGAMLLVPDFVSMIGVRESFTVFGINAPLIDYSSSILPIVIGVWVMSLVEKLIKKFMPDVLSTVFTPFLTILVMVPLMFCAIAPIGSWIGEGLGNVLILFAQKGGFLAVAVIAAIWEFLVMGGMHGVVLMFGLVGLFSGQPDFCIVTAGGIATWAAFGMALGAFIKIKKKDDKSLALGYFISGIIGGVTEPVLYGIGFKYKKPFIALMIGGFIGGLYAGIMHVGTYMLGSTNFLSLLGFVAGGTANIVNGTIASIGAMLITAVLTYILGGFEQK